jgi:D-alanyl-D-alanine carboxypeptidase (penicillin-binding protein 5/6)
MKKILLSVIAACALVFSLSSVAHAEETLAKQAIIIDANTRLVLMEKNSQERMPTSSMSKVMTMYVVFDALKSGRLKLTDTLPVSEKAWRMQGSKMFVELGNSITVEDLIRGVIIQSGNDATIVLAEGIAGSEDSFGTLMNAKAKELGMKASNFKNASGWPDPEHYSTAYDLALLGYGLINNFPEYYKYYSELEYTYHGIKQGNRNPLLYKNIGADGIKTGHTEAAGYGLIGSAVQNGRRLILVVNGLSSMQERADEATRLMQWGFRSFDNGTLFKADDIVAQADTWLGLDPKVPVKVTQDIVTLYKVSEKNRITVKAVVNEPIMAPIEIGREVGYLIVKSGNFPEQRFPLVTAAEVRKTGLMGKLKARLVAFWQTQGQ